MKRQTTLQKLIFYPFKNTFYLLFRRSQLSICSEPTVAIRQLSCQSSIEPCVVEEDVFDLDEKEKWDSFQSPHESQALIESTVVTIENDQQHKNKSRPDSLILNTATIAETATATDTKKFLFRSQSTKSFKKPKLKPPKGLSNDLDQIYVISSNSCMRSDLNDFYDSIEVIHERRSKNFSKFNESEGEKESNTTKNETNVGETIFVDIEKQPQLMNQ